MEKDIKLNIEDFEHLRNNCGECGVELNDDNRSGWSAFYGDSANILIESCKTCNQVEEAANEEAWKERIASGIPLTPDELSGLRFCGHPEAVKLGCICPGIPNEQCNLHYPPYANE